MRLRAWVALTVAAGCACSREVPAAADAGASSTTTANTNPNTNSNASPTSGVPGQDPSYPRDPATRQAQPGESSTSTSTGAPPSPPTPSPLPLSSAVAKAASGEQPLARDGVTMVDPGAGFRVEVGAHLTDGRLSIHDEQDAMVPSSGLTEVGDAWTRFELKPDEPLRPGSTFVLRVDGAAARESHDASGKAYAPVVLRLKTTGERPAAKPSRGKRRR